MLMFWHHARSDRFSSRVDNLARRVSVIAGRLRLSRRSCAKLGKTSCVLKAVVR
jgi:hypothetical protein